MIRASTIGNHQMWRALTGNPFTRKSTSVMFPLEFCSTHPPIGSPMREIRRLAMTFGCTSIGSGERMIKNFDSLISGKRKLWERCLVGSSCIYEHSQQEIQSWWTPAPTCDELGRMLNFLLRIKLTRICPFSRKINIPWRYFQSLKCAVLERG